VGNAVPGSATPAGSPVPPPRQHWSPGGVLALVNGVLAGVGSVYATTRSVTITVIAGLMATALAALMLIVQR
jgi:hypothetical protein